MWLLDAICQGLPPFISIYIIHWLHNIPFMSDLWRCFLPQHFESLDSYLRSASKPSEQRCKTKTSCCSNCFKSSTSEADLFLSRNNSGLSHTSRGQRVVPLSIRDMQRLNTVCSEQLLSKYEDVIDTRSNIDTLRKLAYLHSFFPLCIYLFSAALDFLYS